MTMRHGVSTIIHLSTCAAVAAALLIVTPQQGVLASTSESATHNPVVDSAPCEIAAKADDDARMVDVCSTLLENEDALRPARIAALVARGGAYARTGETERALEDYDTALRFDAKQGDVLIARARLLLANGDRRRALQDFGEALKLKPDHPTVRGEYRALAQELERAGAMMAVDGRPSFDCARARLKVEKAICADPALANLDRQISAANAKVVRSADGDSARAVRALGQAQQKFIAARNAGFGKPDYDLRKAMQERLDALLAIDRN